MSEAQPRPAIRMDGVRAGYEGRPALDDVTFDVAVGTFTALIGPNGAGTSTCLKLLLGLVRPQAGRVEVFGENPGFGANGIGYVPQSVEIPKGFPISVEEVVLMGRYGTLGPGRRPGKGDRERVRLALEQVHLTDLAPRRFQDLSGGQQQRALIARALCSEPRLLLLDEPTAGLDSGARARFYALVCDLQHAQGLTLLCATHDLDVVGEHADNLILLDWTVRAHGPPDEVLRSDAMSQAYPFPKAHVHGHAEGTDQGGAE
jgi:ABC-type Mn2+/Zn2+ transport system ATPase subunit